MLLTSGLIGSFVCYRLYIDEDLCVSLSINMSHFLMACWISFLLENCGVFIQACYMIFLHEGVDFLLLYVSRL
jgi:hypothetical protein